MLALPATLRTQRRHGQNTSLAPPTQAITAAKAATNPARNTATVCQSLSRVRTWASSAMRVNEKLPHNIQTYGRGSGWDIMEPYRVESCPYRRTGPLV